MKSVRQFFLSPWPLFIVMALSSLTVLSGSLFWAGQMSEKPTPAPLAAPKSATDPQY